MNILFLRGNARKGGYTQPLADLFVKGCVEAGATVDDVDLTALSIKPCRGCYSCWTTTQGVCVIRDDMPAVLEKILAADAVVMATPLNAFGQSTYLKVTMDRTLPLTAPVFERGRTGQVRSRLRYPERWPKKMAVIVVAAYKEMGIFDGFRSMFSLYADALGFEWCGALLRPESYLQQFTLSKPKTTAQIAAAFYRAGRELATEGVISAKSQEEASLPLSVSDADFEKRSNIYWEHAVALGPASADLPTLQRAVSSDVRVLMDEMARNIDPLAAARLKAVLQFDFPDKNLHYCIRVNRGSCTLTEEIAEKPDLRVTAAADVWGRAVTRETSMKDALVSRQVRLEGDKSLFTRLDRYFPPPTL